MAFWWHVCRVVGWLQHYHLASGIIMVHAKCRDISQTACGNDETYMWTDYNQIYLTHPVCDGRMLLLYYSWRQTVGHSYLYQYYKCIFLHINQAISLLEFLHCGLFLRSLKANLFLDTQVVLLSCIFYRRSYYVLLWASICLHTLVVLMYNVGFSLNGSTNIFRKRSTLLDFACSISYKGFISFKMCFHPYCYTLYLHLCMA